MKKSILYLLGLTLVLGACSKDSKNATNSDKLTDGQWRLTALTTSFTYNGVESTIDAYTQLADCDKDNFFVFQSGGIFISDEGATLCNPSDPQQETGTWSFTQNETHLVISGTSDDYDAEILELSDTKLRLKYNEDLNGIATTNELTFLKN